MSQECRRPGGLKGRLQWEGGLDLNSLACSARMEMKRSPRENEYAGTRARAVHASGEPSAIWGVLEMDEQGTTGRWGQGWPKLGRGGGRHFFMSGSGAFAGQTTSNLNYGWGSIYYYLYNCWIICYRLLPSDSARRPCIVHHAAHQPGSRRPVSCNCVRFLVVLYIIALKFPF